MTALTAARTWRSRIRAWAGGLAAAAGLAIPVSAAEAAVGAPVWCHVVRSGESLAAVARRVGTSQARLRRARPWIAPSAPACSSLCPRRRGGSASSASPPGDGVARPWTRRFVQQLGEAVYALFGSRLRVTDLTRTEAVQEALGEWNGNAAPARGAVASTHLTGASVDLSKVEHTDVEIAWLRLVRG